MIDPPRNHKSAQYGLNMIIAVLSRGLEQVLSMDEDKLLAYI